MIAVAASLLVGVTQSPVVWSPLRSAPVMPEADLACV